MQLQIAGLSKTYPNGVKALDDATLNIPPGMFGLLGPNGAGKSTLMRTLATLQDADSGSAMLTGLPGGTPATPATPTSTCCATRTGCAGCSATCRRISAPIRKSAPSSCSTTWRGSRA